MSRWNITPVTEHIGADLYLPANEVKAGIVVVPGAADLGKDDPRLVAFANTLARMQFAVLLSFNTQQTLL